MASEAGSISDLGQAVRATDAERSAVAWTALNRVKAGTFGKSVHDVVAAPGQFAYSKEPTSEILDLAARLSKGQIPDPTQGATHFFSPIGMPKEGESTTGFDVGGGLHAVPGLAKKVYFPSWTTKLVWAGALQDVRQKYYMFYRPSGTSLGGPGIAGSSQPRVVFQSRDRSQIFMANADGTGIRLIANGVRDGYCRGTCPNPTWSPDGEKLAYTTAATVEQRNSQFGFSPPVAISHLWLLTSGGKPVELHPGDAYTEDYVAFAPDSAHLLFADGDELYVAKSDGTSKVKVGKRRTGSIPAWSPDGRRIAYLNEFQNLVVVNNDGTQTQRLVPGVGGFEVEWSPDGTRILFYRGSIDLPSGVVTEEFPGKAKTGDDTAPVSPDGKLVVYYQQGHVYVANSDGTARVDLGEGERPQWSPDGKTITYGQTERFGQEVVGQYIFVVKPDGTGKLKIAEGINPRWIPASSWK
jgi:hypothetical protein